MRTLIIYDASGSIIYQAGGNVKEPVGVPFLWVDVPDGMYVAAVDVEAQPNKAILLKMDVPKTPIELLQEQFNELTAQMEENTALNFTVLEAMAQVYEAVFPFLPEQ